MNDSLTPEALAAQVAELVEVGAVRACRCRRLMEPVPDPEKPHLKGGWICWHCAGQIDITPLAVPGAEVARCQRRNGRLCRPVARILR